MMARALVALAFAGPLVLSTGWGSRAGGDASAPAWGALVYAAASRVCHQRPERSFETAGATWPVCARCAGLYLSAPIGALIAVARRQRGTRTPWRVLAAVALPTAATIALEWAGAPMTNALRAAAAVPLGAAVAMLVVDAAGARRGFK